MIKSNIYKQDILDASVEYVSTRLGVYLDDLGRINFYQDRIRDIQEELSFSVEKLLEEYIQSNDFDFIEFTKILDNNFGISDFVSLELNKILSELISFSESRNIEIDKTLVENMTTVERVGFYLDKIFSDQYLVEDLYTSNTNKHFEDSYSISDSSIRGTTKGILDTISAQDSLDRVVEYNRVLEDTVSVISDIYKILFADEESDTALTNQILSDDDPYVLSTKVPDADSVGSSDTSNLSTIKVLLEMISALEDRSVSTEKQTVDSVLGLDSPELLFARSASDQTTGTEDTIYFAINSTPGNPNYTAAKSMADVVSGIFDSSNIQSYKYIYETLTESDSGSLLNTDYVGSYYFNDDFVGSKRTF